MKYLKTYEQKKFNYLKNYVGCKFDKGDIVKLKVDYVNGNFVPGISKNIFKIVEIGADGMYRLDYLNDKFFQWVLEKDIRLAEPYEINTDRYNL